MERNLEEYNTFIDQSPQGCIYSYSWWLDTVAQDQWDYCEVRNNEGIQAVLPYKVTKVNGRMKSIGNASMCQMMGVHLKPSLAKYSKQLSYQKNMMYLLIDQLPEAESMDFQFHYSLSNWQPFYWRGFQQTTNYTYVLDNLSEEILWEGLRSNIRTDIKKSKKILSVRDDLEIEQFISVYKKTFLRQGREMAYGEKFIKNLDRACTKRGQGRRSFAIDKDNRVHAVIYTVWDKNSAYYIMGGADPDLRNSGAHSFLLWDSILFTSRFVKKFDFEGSMNENIERFFRAFGGRQMPIMNVYKKPSIKLAPKSSLIQKIKSTLRV